MILGFFAEETKRNKNAPILSLGVRVPAKKKMNSFTSGLLQHLVHLQEQMPGAGRQAWILKGSY